MKQKSQVRMNIVVGGETHYLLKILCAEQQSTLQDGVVELIENGVAGIRERMKLPPWSRPVPRMVAPAQRGQTPAMPTYAPAASRSVLDQRSPEPPTELAADIRASMEASGIDIPSLAQTLRDKQQVVVQMQVEAEDGSIRETGVITASVDDEGQSDPGYDPDASFEDYRLHGHSREVAIERVRHELDERDMGLSWTPLPDPTVDGAAQERVTPATHDIPADWVNQYGLTLVMQNALERDDNLEYGPPSARPGVAH